MWAVGEGISSSLFVLKVKRSELSEVSSNKSTISSSFRSRIIVAFSPG
jgi:hypothetical protein